MSCTSYRCRVDRRDKASVEVIGDHIYISVHDHRDGYLPHDVRLPPHVARALADRLSEAADEAETYGGE